MNVMDVQHSYYRGYSLAVVVSSVFHSALNWWHHLISSTPDINQTDVQGVAPKCSRIPSNSFQTFPQNTPRDSYDCSRQVCPSMHFPLLVRPSSTHLVNSYIPSSQTWGLGSTNSSHYTQAVDGSYDLSLAVGVSGVVSERLLSGLEQIVPPLPLPS